MYLPRNLLSHLYTHLLRTTHPLSPPVLILVSLDPDALCACRILTELLKRDYIPHKVQPVGGYTELNKAGQDLVKPLTRQHGGDGGVVVCLGVGGLIDLEDGLGLDGGEEEGIDMKDHGVEVWVVDARRPWNLQNVFGLGSSIEEAPVGNEHALKKRRGVDQGRLQSSYTPGKGGVIVFDDGDIEQELGPERDAFCALQNMPDLGVQEDDDDDDDSDAGDQSDAGDSDAGGSRRRKRKSSSDGDDLDGSDGDEEDERPRQRRRSNSGSSIPATREHTPRRERMAISNHPSSSEPRSPLSIQPSSPPPAPSQPSNRTLRRRLLRLRRKHESVLQAYYALGTSNSEPISSMLYALAEDLGREDNDLLWLAIVGVSSSELYGYSHSSEAGGLRRSDWSSSRPERIRQVLQDEVRRLNPIPAAEVTREREMAENGGVIPTHARSPTDTSIRLSPEPRFLLTRHWSLYDSMLHSPYLSSRLHIWTETGRRRLDRLLTKMGVSLDEARKGYTHMDMDLKRVLRQRLLKIAPMYGLDGIAPPADGGRNGKEGWGFVRCWGWKACLSALDVAVIVSAILEVGTNPTADIHATAPRAKDAHRTIVSSYSTRIRALPTPDSSPLHGDAALAIADPDWTTHRFYAAYDALAPGPASLSLLLDHVPTAKHLHRAILRTGAALMAKSAIRHLRAFRMAVVREGPDVQLFVHPGALVKLAGWVAEAVGVQEAEKGARERSALVLGALDGDRGVYVVVGLGGGGAGAGGRMRSRAEMKEREARKLVKGAERERKKLERERKKVERARLRRERNEAVGIFDEDLDEDEEEEDSEEEESSDDDDGDSDDEDEATTLKRQRRGYGLNRFGAAFQEVVEETGARVRIDSFEHCVVEVKKEDFSGFLEALSLKTVVG